MTTIRVPVGFYKDLVKHGINIEPTGFGVIEIVHRSEGGNENTFSFMLDPEEDYSRQKKELEALLESLQ